MECALDEISRVSDDELVGRLERLVKSDRMLSVKLLVHLGEMYERKLYVGRGYSSMFEYCRCVLGMSEAEAGLRLKAAKIGRRFPLVLEQLGAGAVHLTAIKMLAPVFTAENHAQLIERARGKSKAQIELIVAEILQKPDVAARMRRLPDARASLFVSAPTVSATPSPKTSTAPSSLEPSDAPTDAVAMSSVRTQEVSAALQSQVAPAAAARSSSDGAHASVPGAELFALQSPRARASTSALRPGRFKLEVTLGQEAHDKLEQLRELMRHQNPSGDLAVIVERALSELLERTMKKRFGQKNAPKRNAPSSRPAAECKAVSEPQSPAETKRPVAAIQKSRYIPRDVLRKVHARDGGQCTFVSSDGRRCTERGFLEVHHHEIPFARGGQATADNLKLACRVHNFFLAEREYGQAFMQQKLIQAAVAQREHAAEAQKTLFQI